MLYLSNDYVSAMGINSSKTSGILKVIWDNKNFLVPFFLLSTYLIILIGFYGNAELFIHINSYSSWFADHLFLYITDLGDGFISYVLVLILLFFSFREALTFLSITLVIAILVTVIKRHFFPEFNRPVLYFEYFEVLRLVPGYDPPAFYTFPSGHSATSISVYLYLSMLSKNGYVKFSLFCLAALICFSRIYLSAHFPFDVFVGSYIAVTITIIGYYFSRRMKGSWINKKIVFKPKISIR
jgi:membrane-associated phospholipid phosphatase